MSPVALQRGVPGVERDGVVVVHVAGIVVVDVKAAVRAPVVELETKVREDFTITEKAPTRVFSWLKACLLAHSHLGHY